MVQETYIHISYRKRHENFQYFKYLKKKFNIINLWRKAYHFRLSIFPFIWDFLCFQNPFTCPTRDVQYNFSV
jgi:hypothetical protein